MPCCCFESVHFASASTWQPDCGDEILHAVVVTYGGAHG